jgi:hypothetical protein
MPDDLSTTLERLLRSGDIETATVTVVLKPRSSPPPPDPQTSPVCVFQIGPVSSKR